MRGMLAALLILAAVPAIVTPARAATLAVDLSQPVIEISTGFSGADLLLFGAIDSDSDVIAVVSGPSRREVVRRKARIAGIWINADSRAFETVPAYYRVAATRPLADAASPRDLGRLAIGKERIRYGYAKDQSRADAEAFRAALIRNKTREGLYAAAPLPVTVIDDRLFRTNFDFPANVPIGAYKVDVYLLRKGRIVSHKTRVLKIEKVGLEAGIFNFAHRYAALYGIIAIVIALFSGWLAGAIFRKA